VQKTLKELGSVFHSNCELGENRKNHPATFPIELPSKYIGAISNVGDLVADPFLGSGTTLIAADQLDRTCYGMEISPKYCQVILDRYIAHCFKSNKKPDVRINGEVYNPVP
jgi:DNA modification methylase